MVSYPVFCLLLNEIFTNGAVIGQRVIAIRASIFFVMPFICLFGWDGARAPRAPDQHGRLPFSDAPAT